MIFSSGSRILRFVHVAKIHGVGNALAVLGSVVEDNHLRLFDRMHGVTTSGFISLDDASFEHKQRQCLHRYRGVNAWAFRRALKMTGRSDLRSFVDLGCGLGRGCILAAELGFAPALGVELVPEFCEIARENVRIHERRTGRRSNIQILNLDAIEYTKAARMDVYFMFRPFSGPVLLAVLENIKKAAAESRNSPVILYSERMLQSDSNIAVFESDTSLSRTFALTAWGQNFWSYSVRC